MSWYSCRFKFCIPHSKRAASPKAAKPANEFKSTPEPADLEVAAGTPEVSEDTVAAYCAVMLYAEAVVIALAETGAAAVEVVIAGSMKTKLG